MIQIDRAMVLCAGLGTRMRPLTLSTPKPMIRVAGKPLLDHMLDRLSASGVGEAVVNVHWLAEQIETHVSSRTSPRVSISDERARVLETGGGLAKAREMLGHRPIFVTNTDQTWIEPQELALDQMRRDWNGDDMDALLLLARRSDALGYGGRGDFVLHADGRLTRRPRDEDADWIFAGVQILKPETFAQRPVEPFSTNLIWDDLIKAGRLYGCPLDARWLHVGDPDALKAAEAALASGSPA
jgi:N-acetyl-alpha-D-muramate 1-phosphate uridylyltransferase